MKNPAPRLWVATMAGALWCALLAFLVPAAAFAQNERRGGPAGEFDFYVLALSWSPGFCDTGGSERDRDQCSDGAGLGFVVHGLWPQFVRGFPSECSPANRTPSRLSLELGQGCLPQRRPRPLRVAQARHVLGQEPDRLFRGCARGSGSDRDPGGVSEADRRTELRADGPRTRLRRRQSRAADGHDVGVLPVRLADRGADLLQQGSARVHTLPGGGSQRMPPLPRRAARALSGGS